MNGPNGMESSPLERAGRGCVCPESQPRFPVLRSRVFCRALRRPATRPWLSFRTLAIIVPPFGFGLAFWPLVEADVSDPAPRAAGHVAGSFTPFGAETPTVPGRSDRTGRDRAPPPSAAHTGELAVARDTLRRAASDPEAALRWAAAIEDRDEREAALQRVCASMAEWDPGLAVDCAWRLGGSWRDRGGLPALLRLWAERDRAAAMEWTKRIPDTEIRDDLLTSIALAWAPRDPAEATRWVDRAITAGHARERALLAVLPHWLERDPAAAEAWISRRSVAAEAPATGDQPDDA